MNFTHIHLHTYINKHIHRVVKKRVFFINARLKHVFKGFFHF